MAFKPFVAAAAARAATQKAIIGQRRCAANSACQAATHRYAALRGPLK